MSAVVDGLGGRRRATPSRLADLIGRLTSFHAAIGLCLIVGTTLRVAGAQGDLWLDEIWSLNLVARITSPDQVFWAIPHDNNHLLNSLWLYLLGPDRAALAYRMPAIIFGGASILVAARIGHRTNRAASLGAALLVATAYPLVVYGSEARGYAGLVLATLLGIDALDALTIGPPGAERGNWRLAAVIAFGTLCHFTMLAAAAVFGIAVMLRLRRGGRTGGAVLRETVTLFSPTVFLLWIIAAVFATGALLRGGMAVGGVTPFTLAHFWAGFGGLTALLVGLPASMPMVIVVGGLAILVAAGPRLLRSERRELGLAALLVVGAMALARLPNLEMSRYFLVPAVVLVVTLGDMFGTCWSREGRWRLGAAALFVAALAGHGILDARLLEAGRGSYGAAVAMMTRDGPVRYASDADFRAKTVVDHFGGLAPAALISSGDPAAFCQTQPAWFIHDGDPDEAPPPERFAGGPNQCRMVFTRAAVFPSTTLSGRQWVLYRHVR